MALRDRFSLFRRDEPVTQPKKAPRGNSGRGHTGGFLELEELNNALAGQEGLRVFDKMYRSDPDVRGAVWKTWAPIIGATWEVDPFGGDDASDAAKRDAELVEYALFEFMRPGWRAHLTEAIVFVRAGFCPFEQIWGVGEFEGSEVLLPRKLALKVPRSIFEWPLDPDGELKEIVQYPAIGGPKVVYPRRDLVYYRVGAEGDNWEGTSMLRPVYKSWLFKDTIERVDAVGIENDAVGLPVVYPPEGEDSDSEVLVSVEDAVSNYRGGEQGYIIMPGPHADNAEDGNGWRLELLGMGAGKGSGRNPHESLKHHKDGIAAAFIQEFMRLGQGGEGARATADVQQNPFHAAVAALAGIVVDEQNPSVVERIWALNGEERAGPPKLRMAEADETALTELASFTEQLVRAGALHPDDDLEDFFRSRAKLPPADPDARKEREAREQVDRETYEQQSRQAVENPEADDEDEDAEPGDPPKRKPGKPPPGKTKPPPTRKKTEAATFRRQERPLRGWEARMSLDAVEDAIDNARERFEQAGGAAARALARDAAAQAADGKAPPRKAPDELVDALHGELQALYATGRGTVIDELHRQRNASFAAFARDDDDAYPDSLRRRARLAADGIVGRIVQAVMRLAVSGRKSEADLQAAGEQEAAAGLRAEAIAHAAHALNEGRSDEADEHADEIAGSRYTSILDGNTCSRCRSADDDVLRPLADPVRLKRKPPNPDCEGGGACRCLEFFELAEEEAPSA